MDLPFSPAGPTVLVAATAVQISPTGASGSYRVRNLSGSAQYFTHGSSSSVTSIGAPVANTPSQNTIGMLGSSVEVFAGLGPFAIASSATGFEFTPGEGV